MIIGDGIMLGAGGESASIFVTGLSETDSVSATHKIPTKVENPDYHDLPDGYTELGYIQSSGTQYVTVPTPIVSNGFDIEFSLYSAQQPSGFQPLFVSVINYGLWLGWYDGSFIVRTFNHDNIITVSYPFDTFVNVRVVYDGSTVELYFDNVKVGYGSVNFADGAAITYVFYDGSTKISCKLGTFKFSVGNATAYHYIPASNSSDAVGLYDLVNGVFYTNAGTGVFAAGAEVPQYVDEYVDGKTVVGKWTTKTVRKYDVDLIPNMTSDTEPRGVASASMVSGESYAYKAFDGDSETIAYGGYPSIPWSVQYEFEREVTIKKVNYKISNHNYYAGNTIAYQIQISQDGTNWETIHTGSTSNGGQSPYSNEFTLTEPKNAKYIRLYQTSNTGTGYSGALYTLQANGDMDSQTGGFEIAPIKSYGTWTLSNSDGTKTADVLIDAAADFEVTL